MSASTSDSRALRAASLTAAGLWVLCLALWIVDSRGAGLPVGLSRTVVIACLIASGAALAAWLFARTRAADRDLRLASLALLALVVVSLVTFLVGIDHEVGGGYYRDEGHYLKHARLVAEGDFFSPVFIYPHLLYYIDAFGLWIASLIPGAVGLLARGLYGVPEGPLVEWLVLRWIAATMGALTVVPVFLTARRLGGLGAGVLSGLAIVFSPLYSGGFSVNISDGPSAFFAACCLACCASLLDDERLGKYLLAGVAAGLAAGCKYPAGVVAVAIVGVWVYHRVRHRDLSFGLLWAGLAAIVVFVVTTPSFLLFPEKILGPTGVFFGVQQYGKGGWIGVMPTSNTRYYLTKIVENFGWPLLLLGFGGLPLLDRDERRRMLTMAVFPVVYLILICSMSMVVVRNLFPLLPALAALLGLGAATALGRVAGGSSRRRQVVTAAIAVAALALPVARTVELRIGLARPSTREMMTSWVRGHLPRGSIILKESYTSDFSAGEYGVRKSRFATRQTLEEILGPGNDVLLLARNAYHRFFVEANLVKEHHTVMRDRYQRIFDTQRLLHEEAPDRFRRGPLLRLYQLDPEPIDLRTARTFAAGEAFRPGRHRPDEPQDVLQFSKYRRWATFREYFAAGRYRLGLEGAAAGPGTLEARSRDGRLHVGTPVPEGGEPATIELPEDGKYVLSLRLPPGSRVERLSLNSLHE